MSTLNLCVWFFFLNVGCALAQEFAIPAITITVEAHVRDPDGNPVEGAVVNLSLPRYRLGDKNEKVSAMTNDQGVATVEGVAQQDYKLGTGKAGYYYTVGPHRSINTPKGFQQYAIGVQKIDLELRPIRNPIWNAGGRGGGPSVRSSGGRHRPVR